MKNFLLALLIGGIVSCTDVADRYVKKLEIVDIVQTVIPNTTSYLEDLQIQAKAQAYNGCWSNLYVELKKTKEFEYTLKAYGTYESFGVCPELLVTKDTVFNFQPTQKGTYFFHISRMANYVDIDTLIVE